MNRILLACLMIMTSNAYTTLELDNTTDEIIHVITLARPDKVQAGHVTIPAQTKAQLLFSASCQYALYTDGLIKLHHALYFNLDRIADITCGNNSIIVKKYHHKKVIPTDTITWLPKQASVRLTLKNNT